MGGWARSVLLGCVILVHSLTAYMAKGVGDNTEKER